LWAWQAFQAVRNCRKTFRQTGISGMNCRHYRQALNEESAVRHSTQIMQEGIAGIASKNFRHFTPA
jgi:hypothetical protein